MAYTTIDDPGLYFNTILWTGESNTANRNFTGVGFQPDLVWSTIRDDAYHNNIFDSVRGGGSEKELITDTNAAEGGGDAGEYGYISSFTSDGFNTTAGSASGGRNLEYNQSGNTFVAWCWKAGTSFSNDASATSIGDIDSSGSFNNTSGFSICSYSGSGSSGDTIKHGLNTAPKIIIIKKRSATDNWTMLNTNISLDTHLHLNTTDSAVSDPMFTNTAPTTSVFTVDSDGQVNESGHTFIAYCFSEVKGYSRFGVYTGNNNANGNFIYTGFRPAFVLSKDSASGQSWHLIDNKRDTFNDDDNAHLLPNSTNSEADAKTNRGTMKTDLLSNGFKINTDGSHTNGTGTHIYMAFAEAPFVNSNGVPCNAR